MIYSVEDDNSIRELILYTLKSQGFESRGFENGESFFDSIEKELPKLILLDIMLPEGDGFSILKRLKDSDRTKGIPVIMVSAKDSEIDKVTGLDMGADDYIAKPFGMMELISRIRAVLRRYEEVEKNILTFSDICMDLDQVKVYVDKKEVALTYKEYQLLKYLIENKNIVLTRDKILYKVWEIDDNIESRTLDVHIKSLRGKLFSMGNHIETVRGVGYVIR